MLGGAERPFQRRRLRYDPSFAAEAKYAVEQGIPWREYLRRWSLEDRAIVAAVVLEQAAVCPVCGTAEWQWQEDPNAFVPMLHIDHGCMIKDRFADGMRNAPKQPGSSIRMVPRDMAERMSARKARRPRSPREIARARQEGKR